MDLYLKNLSSLLLEELYEFKTSSGWHVRRAIDYGRASGPSVMFVYLEYAILKELVTHYSAVYNHTYIRLEEELGLDKERDISTIIDIIESFSKWDNKNIDSLVASCIQMEIFPRQIMKHGFRQWIMFSGYLEPIKIKSRPKMDFYKLYSIFYKG